MKPAQGRPLGYLAAWLFRAHEWDCKRKHFWWNADGAVRKVPIPLEERQQARQRFMEEGGEIARLMCEEERPRRDFTVPVEPVEPIECP